MAVGGIGGPAVTGPGTIGIEFGLGIGTLGIFGVGSDGVVGPTTQQNLGGIVLTNEVSVPLISDVDGKILIAG